MPAQQAIDLSKFYSGELCGLELLVCHLTLGEVFCRESMLKSDEVLDKTRFSFSMVENSLTTFLPPTDYSDKGHELLHSEDELTILCQYVSLGLHQCWVNSIPTYHGDPIFSLHNWNER